MEKRDDDPIGALLNATRDPLPPLNDTRPPERVDLQFLLVDGEMKVVVVQGKLGSGTVTLDGSVSEEIDSGSEEEDSTRKEAEKEKRVTKASFRRPITAYSFSDSSSLRSATFQKWWERKQTEERRKKTTAQRRLAEEAEKKKRAEERKASAKAAFEAWAAEAGQRQRTKKSRAERAALRKEKEEAEKKEEKLRDAANVFLYYFALLISLKCGWFSDVPGLAARQGRDSAESVGGAQTSGAAQRAPESRRGGREAKVSPFESSLLRYDWTGRSLQGR